MLRPLFITSNKFKVMASNPVISFFFFERLENNEGKVLNFFF